ncbi:MAG: hypothetical protein L0312_29455 [Acidobacteria bacterium]|nr:hypothetical protein [Acidobacteriota bacterium]
MNPAKFDFLQFVAGEEQNMLTSLVNLRPDFNVFSHLDGLWRAAAERIDVPEKEQAVPALFLFVHFQMYVSVAALMRAHVSESFASTRKAIDAALSAYEMILNPGAIPKYEARDKDFQFIKAHIAKIRKDDPAKYPLADQLIQQHDTCSEFGSHADVSSFIYRTELKETDKPNKSMLLFHYFQFPRDREEFHWHFVELLLAFYQMLEVFKPMVLKLSVGLDKSWESELNKLRDALGKEVSGVQAFFQRKHMENRAT